ncbi:hypothetical protein JTB14_008063 [Gonioctena quinquepunctata]|nr:hypothetical protein JTB14_008063 [Gonioctena quinquepunctata]
MTRKVLTQKELEAALEEAVDELERQGHEDVIDAVYKPPDVDTLTDEENIDDENYSPENEPTDIAGTFELHVPDSHNDVREDEQDEWSSSDEEDLASKRKRLAPGSSRGSF